MYMRERVVQDGQLANLPSVVEEGTILVEGGGLGVACDDPNIFSALGEERGERGSEREGRGGL